MTLDEAINHCKEKAKEIWQANEEMPNDCKLSKGLCECANEHEQLAEWLEDYKRLLEKRPQGDLISREALKKALNTELKDHLLYLPIAFKDLINNAPTVEYTFEEAFQKTVCEQRLYCPERPQGEYVDISKLRLMTVEECAGHTIDYAMGWKACVEWIKKGGAE